MTQMLRRSQFITTYGPGSVLEGPNGPRIIPTLGRSEIFARRSTANFEITDQRLSQTLLGNAGILRLPSNAEVGQPDAVEIYRTLPFPAWALCVTHGVLYHKTTDNNRACPRCPTLSRPSEAWGQVRRQAIRFVRACAAGHLDDVDWVGIVPHRRNNCRPQFLLWQGSGGALRLVDIVCPDCGADMNLGIAYSREWRCSGRSPEEGLARPGCDTRAKIIQRGAANLHIPELVTALTIPPRATPLHRLLEMSNVQTVLLTVQPQNKQQLMSALEPVVNRGFVNRSVVDQIASFADETIQMAIRDMLTGYEPATERELRLEEFGALRRAATYGHPPQPSSTPGGPPQFEVVQGQVRTMIRPGGFALRVTPVNRLRVVMVQTGYRRLDPLNPSVDRPFNDGQRLWYPGVELSGEGIFVDLHPGSQPDVPPRHFPLRGAVANSWYSSWRNPGAYGLDITPDNQEQLHPVFVWWHTLAHRLINALAIDSGYSSAAVRERVFIDLDYPTGEAGGGVLLYTAQPGGDGTLGGLIGLVPEFERVLSAALRDLDTCSNDPLCGEESFGPGRFNGAICYTCGLVSETSCEHRNLHLDRTLLRENRP